MTRDQRFRVGTAVHPHPGPVLSYPQFDTTVCTVTGPLDAGVTDFLRDALLRAIRDGNRHLVIDLSGVTFMDSPGLYVLFAARQKHNISGDGHLAVVIDPDSQVIPQLYTIALDVIFDLHHSVAGALHACACRDALPR